MTIQFKGGNRRGIEWCDETRNATGGCVHECQWEMPDGTLAICYAKELAESGLVKQFYPHGFEHHYWRPEMLKPLTRGSEPLLIFCDSMSDLFAANVPAEHVHAILAAMGKAPHHVYMSLTKAAPQLLKYIDRLPPNLWVGVSSPPDWFMGKRLNQRQQSAMLARSMEVLAEVRDRTGNLVWLSAEPVSWDMADVLGASHPLDWTVIGAASSGPRYFQPDAEIIKRLLVVLDATGTPVFYKGNIRPLFERNDLGTPELNRWREDFPESYRSGMPIAAVARRQALCRKHGWTPSRSYAPRALAG